MSVVKETATFISRFTGIVSKDEAYERLKYTLIELGWLTKDGSRIAPLELYRTTDKGECVTTLAEYTLTDEFINLVEELFADLSQQKNIAEIDVKFSKSTESIVYANVDKYARFQSFNIDQMKYGDRVTVFKR